jgi:hypothetical protein
MGQDPSRPTLNPFVFDRIKVLAKGLAADSHVVSQDRLVAFAAAFANEWNAQPQLSRRSVIPFCLRSTICRTRISKYLLDNELGALSGVCQESWDSIQDLRLTHLAYVARCAALTTWPEMRPLACLPLMDALLTARIDSADYARHIAHRAASGGMNGFLSFLSKLVGAIAWVSLAPDRAWFGHWVVDRIHDSSYSEAERNRAGHHVKVFFHRTMGFSDFELEVGDGEFEALFYQAYQDLEVQLQNIVQVQTVASFKSPL